ncbi:MAG TPA: MEDS domain-containing protein [Geobacteraceae bacterium]
MNAMAKRRNSGITLVGDLPWGSHFCQFYQTKKDLLDILVPYYRAGLESNELCVWVTSDFFTTQEALLAMEKGVPGFQGYLAKKQIEIFPYTDWYLKGGSFDLKRTLAMWMQKHDEALCRGFDGMRVSGTPYWLDNKKDWDDFTCYEAEINNVIGGTRLLVLCSYSLEKCGVAEILDVVKNHEFALAMSQGVWQIVRMPGAHARHGGNEHRGA